MGLFDTHVGAMQGQTGGTSGAPGNLLESVMSMINSPETGGLGE